MTLRAPIIGLLTAVLMAIGSMAAFAAPVEITWNDLRPQNADAPTIDFSKIVEQKGVPSLSEFKGDREAFQYYMDTMEFMRQMQPQDGDRLAVEYSGQEIKLAGYVTPISFEGDKVVEFLFVPYHGACIHVPPPPANQIVYVEGAEGLNSAELFNPVWLIGKLSVTSVSTIVADVGYSMRSARVEPYRD